MTDKGISDRAVAVTLVAATISGLGAGAALWVATPAQLQLLSYGLFGAAAVVAFILIVVTARLAAGGDQPGPGGPLPPSSPDDGLDDLDRELQLLLERV